MRDRPLAGFAVDPRRSLFLTGWQWSRLDEERRVPWVPAQVPGLDSLFAELIEPSADATAVPRGADAAGRAVEARRIAADFVAGRGRDLLAAHLTRTLAGHGGPEPDVTAMALAFEADLRAEAGAYRGGELVPWVVAHAFDRNVVVLGPSSRWEFGDPDADSLVLVRLPQQLGLTRGPGGTPLFVIAAEAPVPPGLRGGADEYSDIDLQWMSNQDADLMELDLGEGADIGGLGSLGWDPESASRWAEEARQDGTVQDDPQLGGDDDAQVPGSASEGRQAPADGGGAELARQLVQEVYRDKGMKIPPGLAVARLAAAADVLEGLARDGGMTPDEIVDQVLYLKGAEVGQPERLRLLRTVADATAVERAGSLAALAAYRLQHGTPNLLRKSNVAQVKTPGAKGAGRYVKSVAARLLMLKTTETQEYRRGKWIAGTVEDTPWSGNDVYFLAGDVNGEDFVWKKHPGVHVEEYLLSWPVVAELIKHDSLRGSGAALEGSDVVLLVSFPDKTMADRVGLLVKNALGGVRNVWVTDRNVVLSCNGSRDVVRGIGVFPGGPREQRFWSVGTSPAAGLPRVEADFEGVAGRDADFMELDQGEGAGVGGLGSPASNLESDFGRLERAVRDGVFGDDLVLEDDGEMQIPGSVFGDVQAPADGGGVESARQLVQEVYRGKGMEIPRGLDVARLAAAADVLEGLARDGGMTPDKVVDQVLYLKGAEVGQPERLQLLRTVADATAVERAGSLAALAAYRLQHGTPNLLMKSNIAQVKTPGAQSAGRFAMPSPVRHLMLKMTETQEFARRDWTPGTAEDTPWASDDVYFLVGDVDGEDFAWRKRGKASTKEYLLSWPVVAELIKHDSLRGSGAALEGSDVVLLVSFPDKATADRVGLLVKNALGGVRNVWVTDRSVTLARIGRRRESTVIRGIGVSPGELGEKPFWSAGTPPAAGLPRVEADFEGVAGRDADFMELDPGEGVGVADLGSPALSLRPGLGWFDDPLQDADAWGDDFWNAPMLGDDDGVQIPGSVFGDGQAPAGAQGEGAGVGGFDSPASNRGSDFGWLERAVRDGAFGDDLLLGDDGEVQVPGSVFGDWEMPVDAQGDGGVDEGPGSEFVKQLLMEESGSDDVDMTGRSVARLVDAFDEVGRLAGLGGVAFDAFADRVLYLKGSQVGQGERLRLLRTVADATTAGRAGSVSALVAYYLQHGAPNLLVDGSAVWVRTQGAESAGRYAKAGAARYLRLKVTETQEVRGNRWIQGTAVGTPWADSDVYFLAGDVDGGDFVWKRRTSGVAKEYRVPWDVVAELIKHDPLRGAGTALSGSDVVLLVSFPDKAAADGVRLLVKNALGVRHVFVTDRSLWLPTGTKRKTAQGIGVYPDEPRELRFWSEGELSAAGARRAGVGLHGAVDRAADSMELDQGEGDEAAASWEGIEAAELAELASGVTGVEGREQEVLGWMRALGELAPSLAEDPDAFTAFLKSLAVLDGSWSEQGREADLTAEGLRQLVSGHAAQWGIADLGFVEALRLLLDEVARVAGADLRLGGYELAGEPRPDGPGGARVRRRRGMRFVKKLLKGQPGDGSRHAPASLGVERLAAAFDVVERLAEPEGIEFDAFADRVLYLNGSGVGPQERLELLKLVADAKSAGRAGTVSAVGAHHLQYGKPNLLTNGIIVRTQTPGAESAGRHAKTVNEFSMLALEMTRTQDYVPGGQGWLPVTERDTPWGAKDVYFLVGKADGGEFIWHKPGRHSEYRVPWADVAELIKHDPLRGPGAALSGSDVVLLVSFPDKAAADSAGLSVKNVLGVRHVFVTDRHVTLKSKGEHGFPRGIGVSPRWGSPFWSAGTLSAAGSRQVEADRTLRDDPLLGDDDEVRILGARSRVRDVPADGPGVKFVEQLLKELYSDRDRPIPASLGVERLAAAFDVVERLAEPSGMDFDAFADRVLYLSGSGMGRQERLELLKLVADAKSAGRAGTVSAVGAYHLQHGSPHLLVPNTRIRAQGSASAGRDEKLRTSGRATLAVRAASTQEFDEPRDWVADTEERAPWGTNDVYFFVGDVDGEDFVWKKRTHVNSIKEYRIPWADVAELIRHDPLRGPGAALSGSDVVLIVSFPDRAAADSAGLAIKNALGVRHVWVAERRVTLDYSTRNNSSRGVGVARGVPRAPRFWSAGTVPGAGSRLVVTGGGRVVLPRLSSGFAALDAMLKASVRRGERPAEPLTSAELRELVSGFYTGQGVARPPTFAQALDTFLDAAAGTIEVPGRTPEEFSAFPWLSVDGTLLKGASHIWKQWALVKVGVDAVSVAADPLRVTVYPGADGEPLAGVFSLPTEAGRGDGTQFGFLSQVRGYSYMEPGSGAEGPLRKLPFDLAFVAGIGGDAYNGSLALASGGSAVVDYDVIADFFRPVVLGLPEGAGVVLFGADAAAARVGGADLLEVPLPLQRLANAYQRPAAAADVAARLKLRPAGQGRSARFQFMVADKDKPDVGWAVALPELPDEKLAEAARRVTGDPGEIERVRRWMRALRLVYGSYLESDTPTLFSLLRGFWALDRMRNAAGDQEPLTWDGLVSRVRRYYADRGEQAPPMDVGLPTVLRVAAEQQGTRLDLDVATLVRGTRYRSAVAMPPPAPVTGDVDVPPGDGSTARSESTT